MIREGLYQIATEYPNAKLAPLKGHPLAKFIRAEFPGQPQELVASEKVVSYFVAHGTKFPGAWAGTPWVSVLDTRITSTTQRGVYAVYAFSKDAKRIFLSLGIGVTNTDIRSRRALIKHLQEKYTAPPGFKNGPLTAEILGSEFSPTRFDDAQAFFVMYATDALPPEDKLRADLLALLELLSRILVQCKQWRAMKVGVEIVRELYGVMAARGAAGGFVVTSGTFTDAAKEFAEGRNVVLIDGRILLDMIERAERAPNWNLVAR